MNLTMTSRLTYRNSVIPVKKVQAVIVLSIWLLLIGNMPGFAESETNKHRHQVESYPIMAIFGVYSVQYSYSFHSKLDVIAGLAYVNVRVNDRNGDSVGRMHSPTVPAGLRVYFWRNAHIEYQL